MNIRVGIGYDVHRLEAGCDLIVGGIKVESEIGAIGHSDADVLIHAIIDALLGAASLRDIGYHFPDTNESYKGIDSKILLEKAMSILTENNWSIVNIDSIVCLQSPKISEYIPEMLKVLSKILQIEPERLSIKATTTEKLGFIGKKEGISAQAVCLIIKS